MWVIGSPESFAGQHIYDIRQVMNIKSAQCMLSEVSVVLSAI